MSRRGKRDHPWVSAAALSSLDELARVTIERAGERGRLDPRVVARHLKVANRGWLMDHPSILTALTEVTRLDATALLAPEGTSFVLGSLGVRAFDAAVESPAQLLERSPLAWLNSGGLSVSHVPAGAGMSLWAHVIARRDLAEVARGETLDVVMPRLMTMPVGARALVIIGTLDLTDARERESLEQLKSVARTGVILSHRIVSSETAGAGLLRRWGLVEGWQELLRGWLLERQRKRLKVAIQRGIRETAAYDDIIETPRDLIELATVFAGTRDLDLRSATLADANVVRALIRQRRPALTTRAIERLASALQRSTSARLANLQLNVFGPLSREGWSSLMSEADITDVERVGLLRPSHQGLRFWPDHFYRASLRAEAARTFSSAERWGELCVDKERRGVLDDALDRCTVEELGSLIDAVTTSASSASLDLSGRQEALFSAVARRCDENQALPEESKLHGLLAANLAGLVRRYADPSLPASPLTRPSIESGSGNFDFIADCWAWSLRVQRPGSKHAFAPGLFPGWEALAWTNLPRWWNNLAPALDAPPPSGFSRLLKHAEQLADRIEGEPGSDTPPLMLPFILGKLRPQSELCRRLFSFPWAAKRAAATDAQRVWSLAVAQFGIAQAEPWMKLAGHASPPANLEGIIATVDDADLLSVQWAAQPDWLRDAAFRRVARDPANWEKLLWQLDSSLLGPQHAEILCAMLSSPQGTRAAPLLWRANPSVASERLRSTREADALSFERLVFSAPRGALPDVLQLVERSPRTAEIDLWLRRTILAHPTLAADAFRILTSTVPA